MNTLHLPLVVSFALAFGSSGCASLTFSPAIQSIGEYKNTQKVTDAAKDMPPHSADDVKVLIQTLPEGMTLKDGQIIIDDARYEMLGKVTAEWRNPSGVNMGLWFYDYKDDERWRTGYCAWQVPLSWVTLTLWSWLVPTYYPCRVAGGTEEERRADIIETLQRATKALGGNLVVVAGFGGVDFVTVNTRSGAVVSSTSVGTLSGTGYAFRVKKVAPEPESSPAKGATEI